MKRISLGIDTSSYTTSLVAIDEKNQILYEGRKILTVKEGAVGLRQSEAFFQHVQNLPDLYEMCLKTIQPGEINSIVVSDKPRNILGSYMPVFLAGVQFARVISASLMVPLKTLSHQENHLYACLFNHSIADEFIGVHISGGTSEILRVTNKVDLDIHIIGESLDISFGKLIDRLGVYMGVLFPCGKRLDDLTIKQKPYPLKLSIKNNSFNISGIENQLKKLYDQEKNIGKVAYTLFDYISRLLIQILKNVLVEQGINQIVLSGGVSANSVIRKQLKDEFKDAIVLTDQFFATDHAIGNAYYGNVVMTY